MVEQRGMLNHLVAKIRELGLSEGDSLAQTASPSFDISVWQMLAPLAIGGRVELIPDDEAHDPVALVREVERSGVTVLELVPSMLRAVLQELREGDNDNRPSLGKGGVSDLKQAIHDYLDRHNADPKPFVWTKTAERILQKERRALDMLEAIKAGNHALESEH